MDKKLLEIMENNGDISLEQLAIMTASAPEAVG